MTKILYALSADRLRAARPSDMSRARAARAAGISRNTLVNAEAGTHEVRASTLRALSAIYGVPMESFFVLHETPADHDLSTGVTPEKVQGGSTDGQDPKNETAPEDAATRHPSGADQPEDTDESVGAVLEAAGHAR